MLLYRKQKHLNLTQSLLDEFFFLGAIVGKDVLVVEQILAENNNKKSVLTSKLLFKPHFQLTFDSL
jgi:hypothetical protein